LIKTYGYTQEQLGKKVGKSREHIANTLRLMKLPSEVQKMVVDHKLSMGHVRPLITLDKEKANQIAKKAFEEGLSVRQVEALANKKDDAIPTKQPNEKKDAFRQDIQQKLQQKLGAKVKITGGSINISYHGIKDLNRILEELGIIE
ncbi:MAG: chromosome partitioning protein ParB, partial [Limosilactobacillus mucosae]|nr:chromosome partitioning protein ParB [Limosilactobacillus mucosae]